MARLKIGVAGLRGIPHVMGGIEAHCEELYPRLSQLRGGDSFVVIARSPYVPAEPAPYRGIPIVPVFTIRNKYLETILNTILAVLTVRFRLRCGTVHLHGIGPALLSPLVRLLGLRLVVTHHGEDFNRAKWNRVAKLMLRFGEWCAIHFSHQLIVVSAALARDLQRRYPRQAARITPIPNGATLLPLMPPDAAEDILARLGVTSRGYVLAVGRLVPEKGFHDLIEAFLKADTDAKLVICGKADHVDGYAEALMARASDRVIFAGYQTHAALRTLYEHARLFVLPSYHEGLPIAALEAAGTACPTLLSDIAPNKEIGLAPACYFPVGNTDALAAKLSQDPAAFAVDGRAITARFDWDEVARATSQVYDRLAAA
jgi:glycosyltransferase involved in cell wall biosynthesis